MSIVPYTILLLSGPEKILFPLANMKQKTTSTPPPHDIQHSRDYNSSGFLGIALRIV
jgi:hypothetical protein